MSYTDRKSFKTPLVLDADSYKYGHWKQLPKATSEAHGYISSRGGKYSFVVQGPILPLLHKIDEEIRCMSLEDVELFKSMVDKHIRPGLFHYEGWKKIVEIKCLPVKIYAIPEATVVPTGVPMYRIETYHGFAWLEGFLETLILRNAWYGSTVSTITMAVKLVCAKFLKETSDNFVEALRFMIHDFGSRGVSSDESAQIGSMSHQQHFFGTDTMAGIWAIYQHYHTDVCSYSVLATEHTTTTANSDALNQNDYGAIEMAVRLLEESVKETGQFQIVACVNDTYDDTRHVTWLGTDFKDRIANSGGRFVTRCDSGDPVENPLRIMNILLDLFGYTVNSKGYKVLPPYIRLLQGDGINEDSIDAILTGAKWAGISAENFVFGMGGALLQHCDRDWLKFAMKCSAIKIGTDPEIDIFKNPKSAPDKRSMGGILTTIKTSDGDIHIADVRRMLEGDTDIMKLVFNGKCIIDYDWNSVRERANSEFEILFFNTYGEPFIGEIEVCPQ